MTRRDFELIAATIAAMAAFDRQFCARAFANALAGTNPQFDRDRFLRACGVS